MSSLADFVLRPSFYTLEPATESSCADNIALHEPQEHVEVTPTSIVKMENESSDHYAPCEVPNQQENVRWLSSPP